MVGMDLASPLRTIAPGLDSAVLQVLAGTESSLSASQIARLAQRGSRAGQLPVLSRLVEHGLVIADRANQGYMYSLNRQHVLAGPVLAAMRARSIILERLTAAADALRPAPLNVSAFGSFARGQAGPTSDIDLLIITPSDAESGDEWLGQVHDLADRTLAWTGNRLEYLTLTLDRLRHLVEAGEPIVTSWLDEALTLSGTPFVEILNDLANATERDRTS